MTNSRRLEWPRNLRPISGWVSSISTAPHILLMWSSAVAGSAWKLNSKILSRLSRASPAKKITGVSGAWAVAACSRWPCSVDSRKPLRQARPGPISSCARAGVWLPREMPPGLLRCPAGRESNGLQYDFQLIAQGGLPEARRARKGENQREVRFNLKSRRLFLYSFQFKFERMYCCQMMPEQPLDSLRQSMEYLALVGDYGKNFESR